MSNYTNTTIHPKATQPRGTVSRALQPNAIHARTLQSKFPQSNVPQSNVPQSNVPQSKFPQSNVPQSKFPQSKFPQSKFPQSKIPQSRTPKVPPPSPNTNSNTGTHSVDSQTCTNSVISGTICRKCNKYHDQIKRQRIMKNGIPTARAQTIRNNHIDRMYNGGSRAKLREEKDLEKALVDIAVQESIETNEYENIARTPLVSKVTDEFATKTDYVDYEAYGSQFVPYVRVEDKMNRTDNKTMNNRVNHDQTKTHSLNVRKVQWAEQFDERYYDKNEPIQEPVGRIENSVINQNESNYMINPAPKRQKPSLPNDNAGIFDVPVRIVTRSLDLDIHEDDMDDVTEMNEVIDEVINEVININEDVTDNITENITETISEMDHSMTDEIDLPNHREYQDDQDFVTDIDSENSMIMETDFTKLTLIVGRGRLDVQGNLNLPLNGGIARDSYILFVDSTDVSDPDIQSNIEELDFTTLGISSEITSIKLYFDWSSFYCTAMQNIVAMMNKISRTMRRAVTICAPLYPGDKTIPDDVKRNILESPLNDGDIKLMLVYDAYPLFDWEIENEKIRENFRANVNPDSYLMITNLDI